MPRLHTASLQVTQSSTLGGSYQSQKNPSRGNEVPGKGTEIVAHGGADFAPGEPIPLIPGRQDEVHCRELAAMSV
jgi:hypothetical protein